MELKLITSPENQLPPNSATPSKVKVAAACNGVKILVADDSEINRLMVGKFLQQRGFEVETANNGQEAVEVALKSQCGAILMDLHMPLMDGQQAARALRQRGFDRPIIAVTAQAMLEDRGKCLQAGCDDFFTKPIQFDLLFSTLQRLCADPNRG
jgi:CheY-like chemotaxis protein